MARLFVPLSFAACTMFGALMLCGTLFGTRLEEGAPHAIIALAAVAVHVVNERFVPAYAQAAKALARLFRRFLGR